VPSNIDSKNDVPDIHMPKTSITGIHEHVQTVKSMYPAHSRVAIVGCGT
jgi:hypothetical protein